jgi:hypothetical protein
LSAIIARLLGLGLPAALVALNDPAEIGARIIGT